MLKDVFTVVFRWWQLNFMAKNQVEIQARLLEGYLVGPYAWHLTKNTSDEFVDCRWRRRGWGTRAGLRAVLAFVTEALAITSCLVSPDVHLPCRDGCSDRLLRGCSSHRSKGHAAADSPCQPTQPRGLEGSLQGLAAIPDRGQGNQAATARRAHSSRPSQRPARKVLKPV